MKRAENIQKRGPWRRLLRSALPPAVLLAGVLLCRTRTAWADWYALHFYPVWSAAASRVSALGAQLLRKHLVKYP